jgi:hypothetical protein
LVRLNIPLAQIGGTISNVTLAPSGRPSPRNNDCSTRAAIATGQTQTSGTAVAPKAIEAAPFVVRVKLDDDAFAKALPAGSTGTAAIYTDHVKISHVIRRVLLRQVAILNYVNPL